MSNMSHCRFQNTKGDLFDCVEALEMVDELKDLDLSPEEFRAFKSMLAMCNTFSDIGERLLEDHSE